MRELVYLSDAKLEQFLPSLRSLWPRPNISLKAPFAAMGVNLAPSAQRARIKHLDQITDQMGRSATWFTDPELTAGQ